MEGSIITCIVLCLCIVPSLQQTPRCLLSREDYLICKYQNRQLERAGTNQYSIHHTRLRQGASGFLECNVRASEQEILNITDLGTEEMRVLYSPGFILRIPYDNQLRTEYVVQCESDEMAFFNVTDLDLQGPEDCEDEDGSFRCQDYLQISRGGFGTTDICGNVSSPSAVVELEFGDYVVVFRTSEEIRGRGFQMYSVCYRPEETNLEGCFNVTEFTTGVCNATDTTDTTPVPTPVPTSVPTLPPTSESKRAADQDVADDYGEEEVATTYAELFPGYPQGLRMARDLANFHHQWNRRKRVADYGQLITRNILFNETVFYKDNTITVFDPNSATVPVFEQDGVLVLQTFNVTGDVDYHLGEFKGDRTPHFTGPGPLKILGRHAYFQLFVIDPRGVLPTEEEQVELVAMTAPLLAAVPPEDDIDVTDPDQQPADLSIFPGIINKRQADELPSMAEEAVLSAIRNMNACNPVLRAQARATLEHYEEVNPDLVERLRRFDISCSLGLDGLSCTSANATLPGRTTCRVDDQTATPCEPFAEPVPLPQNISSVAVTAINCLGQIAESFLSLVD